MGCHLWGRTELDTADASLKECVSENTVLRLEAGPRDYALSLVIAAAAAAAKSLQSCPTLCDPIDGSPPGSAVPGILQARTLE